MRGIYGLWLRRFDPGLLARHNLDIMRLEVFEDLFPAAELARWWCGYLGTFDTASLRAGDDQPAVVHSVRWLHRLQRPLNALMRIGLRGRGFDTAAFSPSLLYVGQKRS